VAEALIAAVCVAPIALHRSDSSGPLTVVAYLSILLLDPLLITLASYGAIQPQKTA
jgi:hypothetical protein